MLYIFCGIKQQFEVGLHYLYVLVQNELLPLIHILKLIILELSTFLPSFSVFQLPQMFRIIPRTVRACHATQYFVTFSNFQFFNVIMELSINGNAFGFTNKLISELSLYTHTHAHTALLSFHLRIMRFPLLFTYRRTTNVTF